MATDQTCDTSGESVCPMVGCTNPIGEGCDALPRCGNTLRPAKATPPCICGKRCEATEHNFIPFPLCICGRHDCPGGHVPPSSADEGDGGEGSAIATGSDAVASSPPIPDRVEPVEAGESACPSVESLARRFHDAYERRAPSMGYETRPESRVPWDNVPASNRALMILATDEATKPLFDLIAQLRADLAAVAPVVRAAVNHRPECYHRRANIGNATCKQLRSETPCAACAFNAALDALDPDTVNRVTGGDS